VLFLYVSIFPYIHGFLGRGGALLSIGRGAYHAATRRRRGASFSGAGRAVRAKFVSRGTSGLSRRGAFSGAGASSTKMSATGSRRRPPRGADRGRRAADCGRLARGRRPRWPGRALNGRAPTTTCVVGGDATEDGDATEAGNAAHAKRAPGAEMAVGLSVCGAKLRIGRLGARSTGASTAAAAGRRIGASGSGADLRLGASRAACEVRGSPRTSRQSRSRADETAGASRARGRRSADKEPALLKPGARSII